MAQDELSDEEICARVGIRSRQTLNNWKRHPEFQERVREHVAAFREAIREKGIAVLENRVAALNDRWGRLRQVMLERAADPEMALAPGGTTGLLVRQFKGLGSGDNFQIVEEYSVDTALLKELRDHERQAAQELGQWTERRELGLNVRDLDAAIERELARLASGGEGGAAAEDPGEERGGGGRG